MTPQSSKCSPKGTPKNSLEILGTTETIAPEKRRHVYGTTSVVLDEEELREAGIKTYRVHIRERVNGKWEERYNKVCTIPPKRKE